MTRQKCSRVSVVAQWGLSVIAQRGFLKKRTTTKHTSRCFVNCMRGISGVKMWQPRQHPWGLRPTSCGLPGQRLSSLTAGPPRHRRQPATCPKRPRATSEVPPGGPCNLSWRIKPQVLRLRDEQGQVGQGWRGTSFRRASSAKGTPNTIFCWRKEQRW